MKDTTKQIELDPFTREILTVLGPDVWLVGGYVRDRLLGRDSMDRDLVIPRGQLADISLKIKKLFKIVEVNLKGTVRFVFKDGSIIDITEIQGAALEEDLQRRDFTINAMALDREGLLIDPLKGQIDLKRGLIRALQEDNLIKDPVRMLRAWRFSSELDFEIEHNTKQFINKNRQLLLQSAGERITLELFHFLQGPACLRRLEEAIKEGPLGLIFSLKSNRISSVIKRISQALKKLKVSPEIQEELQIWSQFSVQAMVIFFGLVLALGALPEPLVLPDILKKTSTRLLLASTMNRDTPERVFEFFEATGRAGLMYLLLQGEHGLIPSYFKYRQIKENPPITGHDLIKQGIKEGPEIKRLLVQARRAAFLQTMT